LWKKKVRVREKRETGRDKKEKGREELFFCFFFLEKRVFHAEVSFVLF
jgi:hypothetical protein